MSSPDFSDAQQLESFVPVYDAVPDKWEDARPFIVEQLKKISNAVNIREIGWFLDEELLSGKAFIPGSANIDNLSTSQVFRQVLRKVIVFPGLVAGANIIAHGITNDANYEQIALWACATNSTTLTSTVFGNSDTIRVIGPDVIITSDGTYDRCKAYLEYIQEQ
jgi:hypothetical protein